MQKKLIKEGDLKVFHNKGDSTWALEKIHGYTELDFEFMIRAACQAAVKNATMLVCGEKNHWGLDFLAFLSSSYVVSPGPTT